MGEGAGVEIKDNWRLEQVVAGSTGWLNQGLAWLAGKTERLAYKVAMKARIAQKEETGRDQCTALPATTWPPVGAGVKRGGIGL